MEVNSSLFDVLQQQLTCARPVLEDEPPPQPEVFSTVSDASQPLLCEIEQEQQPLEGMKLMLPEKGNQPQEMEHEEQHSSLNTTCDVEQDDLDSSGSTTCDAEGEHQNSSESTTCDAEKEEEEYCIPEQQEIFFVPCGNHNSPRRKRRKLIHEWSQATKQKTVANGVKPLPRQMNVNHAPNKDKFDQAEGFFGSNKPNSNFSSPKHDSHESELAMSILGQPTAPSPALSILNDGVQSTFSNTGPRALSTSTTSLDDTIFNKEFLGTVLSMHSRYFSLDMRALLQIALEVGNLRKMKYKSAMAWLSTINRLVSQTTNFDSIRDPSCFGAAATTPTMLMQVATESSQVTEPCFLPKRPQFFFATLQFHLLEVGPSRLYCMDHARLPVQLTPVHPGQSPRPQSSGEEEQQQLLTTVCCLNAAGDSVPPFLLLPSKLDKLSSSPGFSLTVASFCDWLQFFVSRSGSSPQQPTVLLVRGGQRFLHSVAAQRLACKAGLVLLSFPLHLPNAINPLPEFFFSLTTQFKISCDRWLASNQGSRQLEQTTVASLYALSFKLAATQSAVAAYFKEAGLYPLVGLENLHAHWKLVKKKKRTVQSLQIGKVSKVDDNTQENVSCSASEKVLRERLAHCNQQITGIVQNPSRPACLPHPTDNNLAPSTDLSGRLAGSRLELQSSGLASQQQPAVAVYRVRLPETHSRPRTKGMACPTRPVPGTIFSGPPSAQSTSRPHMALPARLTGGQRMAAPLLNTRDINSNKMSALAPRPKNSCSSSLGPSGVFSQSSNSSSIADYITINHKGKVTPTNGTLRHDLLAKNTNPKPHSSSIADYITINHKGKVTPTNGTLRHDLLAKNTNPKLQLHSKDPPSIAVAQDSRDTMQVLKTPKSWGRGSNVLSGEVSDRRLTPPRVTLTPGPFRGVPLAGDTPPKSTSLGSRPLRNTARKRTRPTATRFRPTRHLSTEVSCPVCLESTEEEWIQCMHCKSWVHELCADIRDPVFYYCDFCLLKHKGTLVGVGGEGIRSAPSAPAPEPAKALKATTIAGISATIEAVIKNTSKEGSGSAAVTEHGDEFRRLECESPSGDTYASCTDSEVCAKTRPGSVCPSNKTIDNSANTGHGFDAVCPLGDTNTCSANMKCNSEKSPVYFSNAFIGDVSLARSSANAATHSQIFFDSSNEGNGNIRNTSDQISSAITIYSECLSATVTASLAPTSHAITTTDFSTPTCPATTTTTSFAPTSPATTTTASLAPTCPATTTAAASLAPTNVSTNTDPLALSSVSTNTEPLAPSSVSTTADPICSTSDSTTTDPLAQTSVSATTDPLAPTSVSTTTDPLAPTSVSTTTDPLAPTSDSTTTDPLAPTSVSATTDPLAPTSVSITTDPLAPTNVSTTTDPLSQTSLATAP